MKNTLQVIIIFIIAFTMGAFVMDQCGEKPKPIIQQSVFFQPDTINLEVGGQIFRYGALTVFGEDTVTVSAFLHDPTVKP